MKTLFKQPFPMLVATIVTTATLAACSNEMNPADVSAVEPQAVAVRFSTPSTGQAAAEDLWQEGDRVTVEPQAQGDPSITFGYTKQEDETYVWQNILQGDDNYFKAILPASFTAYYPTTEGTSIDIFTLPNISDDGQTWRADQSSAALLHEADYMTAPSTTVAQVDQALDLTLAHRLCRLTFVVTEYGNEFKGVVPTLKDVKIKSQHQTVSLTYEVDQVEVDATGDPVWVFPLTPTNASDQPTYTAIVTPCDLTSGTTELMSLTVNNGTPLPVKYKGNLTALASGSAYTFHLQVGKDYVTVTGSDVTGWTGEKTDVTSNDVFTASDLKIGDYYYSDGETSDGGLRKLYTDGTFVMAENVVRESGKTVIGIVYWVGDATKKDKTLKKDHPKCTHGLVVALSGVERVVWQNSYISVQDWLDRNPNEFLSVQTGTEADAPLNNIQGYNNTKAIEAFNADAANSGNLVTAVEKAVDYRTAVPAPGSSSGWYLPSAKELTLLCGRDINDIGNKPVGTANCDLINGQLQLIDGATELSLFYHWSSSEYSDNDAFYVGFGSVNYNNKHSGSSRVRFSLAF